VITFLRYLLVGVLNTSVHWAVFAVIFFYGASQSLSNFIAFCIAVTLSFFINAKWTFNSDATTIRYMMYVAFMGAMASLVGWIADEMKVNPVVTLVIFSIISLICGFIYSKFIIFRLAK